MLNIKSNALNPLFSLIFSRMRPVAIVLSLTLLFTAVAPAQTASPTDLSNILKILTELQNEFAAFKANLSTTQQIVQTSQANAVQPGMGGIPMTGIIPMYTSQITALGTLAGPPINTNPVGTCDKDLIARMQVAPRSADQPTVDWSCGHLARTLVTQFGYQSTTNGNCYYATTTGLYKLKQCPVGLPQYATDATGSLLVQLDPTDPSINWTAAGAMCTYTPGDTGSQYYGALAPATCGMSNNGRNQPPIASQFCGIYPNDSTCKVGTPATTTSSSGTVTAATPCRLSTECGGKACLMVTATQPGLCSLN